jgi:hypothetical protein
LQHASPSRPLNTFYSRGVLWHEVNMQLHRKCDTTTNLLQRNHAGTSATHLMWSISPCSAGFSLSVRLANSGPVSSCSRLFFGHSSRERAPGTASWLRMFGILGISDALFPRLKYTVGKSRITDVFRVEEEQQNVLFHRDA